MKAASFAIGTVSDLANEDARAIAGGQSLVPMLAFRAARPARLVPLASVDGLRGAHATAEAITLGALTTHAEIADGRTPDLEGGVLARIAGGIAYRAVRTRGTIGGSLCHADPAADWLTTLTALDAILLTTRRTIALRDFVLGPYLTRLEAGELLRAVRIPRPAPGFGWGYHKLCRKSGEFAHAMAACLRTRAATTLIAGALDGPPQCVDPERLDLLGPLHRVAARLALEEAGA